MISQEQIDHLRRQGYRPIRWEEGRGHPALSSHETANLGCYKCALSLHPQTGKPINCLAHPARASFNQFAWHCGTRMVFIVRDTITVPEET